MEIGNLHAVLVHFPIGLSLAGAVMASVGKKNLHNQRNAALLFGITVLSAMAASWSGEQQVLPIMGPKANQIYSLHRVLGTWSTFLAGMGFLLYFHPGTRRVASSLWWFLALVFSLTGWIGTMLGHGVF